MEETPLPGIGMRKEVTTASGRRVGIISHRDGTVELIVSSAADPDACVASIPLTGEEAASLGNLLGGHQVVMRLAEEHSGFDGVITRQFMIRPGSPFDGSTLGDTHMRTTTGVSIVAIMRDGATIASPAPDFGLRGSDVLIVVGAASGLDAAATLLNGS